MHQAAGPPGAPEMEGGGVMTGCGATARPGAFAACCMPLLAPAAGLACGTSAPRISARFHLPTPGACCQLV